ncbi:hypothetical protein AB3480_32155 [Rhizobium mongolense]|uniref:competence protein CoiA family protein n=1 Tax=Rhizobium mongolense TaxID=57676 RepID=UPI0034A24CC9
MGQIAYDAATGEMMEAFSMTDEAWGIACQAPSGAILMPRTGSPAVPKVSIRGLRFFAHHPGCPDKLPAPESYAHTRLKIDIARTLRRLGFKAKVEASGQTSDGEQWIADVLAETIAGQRFAFEIQFSTQHVIDFRRRTTRYRRSGVVGCWFMPERPVASRLEKALIHENLDYYQEHGEFVSDCEEIIAFTLDLTGKDTYPEELPLVRFSRGSNIQRLPLPVALAGMMGGAPRWEKPFGDGRQRDESMRCTGVSQKRARE